MPTFEEDEPVIVTVTSDRLQALFNESQYPKLIETNQLRKLKESIKHIENREKLEERNLPYCTNSEFITWGIENSSQWRVSAHCYKKPDGTLGCSGKLDPKFMILKGKIYKLRKNSTK